MGRICLFGPNEDVHCFEKQQGDLDLFEKKGKKSIKVAISPLCLQKYKIK